MTSTKWTPCAVEGSLPLHNILGLARHFHHRPCGTDITLRQSQGRLCPSPLTLVLMLLLRLLSMLN